MPRLTDIYGDMDGLRTAEERREANAAREASCKLVEKPAYTIAGPYHYAGEPHACFRIDAHDRYIGSVAIHDDEDAAYEIAEAFVAALATVGVGGESTL